MGGRGRVGGAAALLLLAWPHALQAQSGWLIHGCKDELATGQVHVSGEVANAVSGRPLAGARIEAVSPSGAVLAETHSQIAGEYRLCNLRLAPGLALRAVYGANRGEPAAVADSSAIMNLAVSVSSPITVMGTVVNRATRQPLQGALVTLAGTGFSAVTNHEGKFSFLDVPPARYALQSTLLGYASRADSLTLLRNTLGLRVALAEQAIPLDPIDVSAPAAAKSARDAEIDAISHPAATRFLGLTPSEMEHIRPRATSIFDVIRRANIPGMRIKPTRSSTGGGRSYCLEHSRGRNRGGGRACNPVAVFVDGALVSKPTEYLNMHVRPNDVSHIQFLPAMEAFLPFGNRAENGALLITTGRWRPRR